MNTELFTLKMGDLGRGLAVAILAAVFMQLGTPESCGCRGNGIFRKKFPNRQERKNLRRNIN